MSDVITTSMKTAALITAKAAKVNATAAVIAGIGTLVTSIAALGVKEIILKAMDNNSNKNS